MHGDRTNGQRDLFKIKCGPRALDQASGFNEKGKQLLFECQVVVALEH